MVDAGEIEREGVKLLEEFSSVLADVAETGETHYVVDLHTVTRKDGRPADCSGFREKFLANAPSSDGKHILAEKAP